MPLILQVGDIIEFKPGPESFPERIFRGIIIRPEVEETSYILRVFESIGFEQHEGTVWLIAEHNYVSTVTSSTPCLRGIGEEQVSIERDLTPDEVIDLVNAINTCISPPVVNVAWLLIPAAIIAAYLLIKR